METKKFLADGEKEVEIFFKTGTIVSYVHYE